MLGLRGVRLGIVKPGLYAMQVRAIVEAAVRGQEGRWRPARRDHDPAGGDRARAAADARRAGAGGAADPRPRGRRAGAPRVGHDDRAAARGRHGGRDRASAPTSSRSGRTTSRRPRSASAATTSASSSGMYEERKLVPANPFVTVDRPGVGRLMQIAVRGGPRGQPATCTWGSAASTAATRRAWCSATSSGWTT